MQGEANENTGSGARESSTLTDTVAGVASDAYVKAAEMTGDAAQRVRRTAVDAASSASTQVKSILDGQVGTGAGVLGDIARSAHLAADDLERSSPLAGKVVRGLAYRMSGYADDLRGQKTDDLLRTASDFTRRQPALVFGLAALAGFFTFRAVKHAPIAERAPSIHPSQQGYSSNLHGAHG